MKSEERAGSATAWLMAIAVGAVAWVGAYPPMGDLPLHESIAALFVHRGDPTWAPAGLYETSLGHAQQLVQLAMAAAMLVLPSALAAKLVVSLSLAGVVGSTARLLRHLGRTPWAAAAVSPLALGWLFHWGFVSNLAGLAIFGLLAVDVDRLAEAPSPRRSLVVAGWLALSFLAHASAAIAAVAMLGVLTAVRRRRVLVALAPAVVVVVALVVERTREAARPTALARVFAERTLWHGPLAKLRALPALVAGRYETPIQLAIVVMLVLALVVLAQRRFTTESAAGGRLVAHRFLLVAAGLLVLFVASPYSVNYGAWLYARFLGPAWICLVAGLAPARPSFATKAAPVACILAAAVALAPEIQRADEHHRRLAALYPRIEKGSAVAVVAYGKGERSAWHPSTAGHRVLAERGGRTLSSFEEYPTSPLTIPPAKRWDELVVRVYADPGALRPTTDLDVVRYVLAWVPDATLWPLLEAAFRPDARLVAREGEWLLFESTHTVRPVDAPLPAWPEADTLQSRVYAVIEAASRRNAR